MTSDIATRVMTEDDAAAVASAEEEAPRKEEESAVLAVDVDAANNHLPEIRESSTQTCSPYLTKAAVSASEALQQATIAAAFKSPPKTICKSMSSDGLFTADDLLPDHGGDRGKKKKKPRRSTTAKKVRRPVSSSLRVARQQ
ncbi:MAG: hypothetical protein AAFQ17_05000, partial [Pseudomonadota bacterium]